MSKKQVVLVVKRERNGRKQRESANIRRSAYEGCQFNGAAQRAAKLEVQTDCQGTPLSLDEYQAKLAAVAARHIKHIADTTEKGGVLQPMFFSNTLSRRLFELNLNGCKDTARADFDTLCRIAQEYKAYISMTQAPKIAVGEERHSRARGKDINEETQIVIYEKVKASIAAIREHTQKPADGRYIQVNSRFIDAILDDSPIWFNTLSSIEAQRAYASMVSSVLKFKREYDDRRKARKSVG